MANTTRITLTITPEGAAFADSPRQELARILRKLADQLDGGYYATFSDLPSALFDSNGNQRGELTVDLVDDLNTWAKLLRELPVITEGRTTDLRLETEGFRIWLSRCGAADGEPFDATVYVEENGDDDEWWEVGYFDGDVTDPKPVGLLGWAFDATRDAVAAAKAES